METIVTGSTKGRYSKQQREDFIRQWKASGMSKKEFCELHPINYYTFITWLNPKKQGSSIITASKQSKHFSQMHLPPPVTSALFARIVTGKSTIELFHPVSGEFIRQLLHS